MFSLRSGDVMEVPVGSAHVHPHTDASTTAVVEHTIEPRPRFVPVFFASWLTWLGEGKVDRQDEPTLGDVRGRLALRAREAPPPARVLRAVRERRRFMLTASRVAPASSPGEETC